MSSTAFRRWRPRMVEPVWEKGWIDQWHHSIWRQANGFEPGGKRTNLTDDEAAELQVMFRVRVAAGTAPRVTDKQAQQGRDWLVKNKRRLKLPDLDYATITHFQFVGVDGGYRDSYNGRDYAYAAPIYLGHLPDGTKIRYSMNSWQSGDKHVEFTVEAA